MNLIIKMVRDNKKNTFNTNDHFVLLKQGDMSQRNLIVSQWLGLALKIVNSYYCDENCDLNDYFSVAVEGLIKAVDTFDLSKNIEFSTYATHCIKHEVIKFIKYSQKNKFSSLDVSVYNEDGEESSQTLIESIVAEDDGLDFQKLELKNDYEELLKVMEEVLTVKELKILKLRFGFVDGVCWTFGDISKKFGVSGVHEIVNRAIVKVQKRLFMKNSNANKTTLAFPTQTKQKMQLVYEMQDKMDKVLNEKELQVIRARFGLLDGVVRKQTEVDKIVGLSRVRVGELERSAFIKLQVENSKNTIC